VASVLRPDNSRVDAVDARLGQVPTFARYRFLHPRLAAAAAARAEARRYAVGDPATTTSSGIGTALQDLASGSERHRVAQSNPNARIYKGKTLHHTRTRR